MLAHRGVSQVRGTAATPGAQATAGMEEVLGVLNRAGVPARDTASLFHTLISYTIGAVAIESAVRHRSRIDSRDPDEQLRQSRLYFEAAPRPQYPNIVALAPHLGLESAEAEFDRGLDRVLG